MQTNCTFFLPDAEATLRFGQALAHVTLHTNLSVLLLQGDLGAGKTTLVRGLVADLPDGHAAEVASPSFTICNFYSTEPPVHHFDLYRLEPFVTDEGLEESLEDPLVLTVVEWSERLSPKGLPGSTMVVHLAEAKNLAREGRQAHCSIFDTSGEHLLALLRERLEHDKAIKAVTHQAQEISL